MERGALETSDAPSTRVPSGTAPTSRCRRAPDVEASWSTSTWRRAGDGPWCPSAGVALDHRLAVGSAGAEGSVVDFWNRVELPAWLSGTVSSELVLRFLAHTATFALANIKDILELGEEADVARLAAASGRDVPPAVPLAEGPDRRGDE